MVTVHVLLLVLPYKVLELLSLREVFLPVEVSTLVLHRMCELVEDEADVGLLLSLVPVDAYGLALRIVLSVPVRYTSYQLKVKPGLLPL